MPNVVGLDAAPDLITSHPRGVTGLAYGRHCLVNVDERGASLVRASDGVTLATFDGKAAKAALAKIDADTVTPVNAFLRPFGKVKAYWRAPDGTNPYRWHPVSGAASPTPKALATTAKAPKVVAKAPKAPAKVAPVEATPAPVVEAAKVAAPVVEAHPATGIAAIPTVTTWRDQYKKRPTQRSISKTFSIVGDVLLPSADLAALDAIKVLRATGEAAHLLITGPRGTAKTKVATQWAYVNDLPVAIIAGQSIQTADDWFGSVLPATSPTATAPFEWVWNDAARLILTGEPCVIILDELNRAENERALNGVMGLLDWRAIATPLSAPHAIRLAPGQIVIATLNEGIDYSGTVDIDAAVRDRFSIGGGIRMNYTSEAIEARIIRSQVPGIDATAHGPEVAVRLARIAGAQRAKVVAKDGDESFPSGVTLSARAVVGIAKKIVATGMTPSAAIWITARATFQPEDEKGLRGLIESQFGPDAAPVDPTLVDDDEVESFLDAL